MMSTEIKPDMECSWLRNGRAVRCRVIAVYSDLGGVAKVHIGGGHIEVVPLAELVAEADKPISSREQ